MLPPQQPGSITNIAANFETSYLRPYNRLKPAQFTTHKTCRSVGGCHVRFTWTRHAWDLFNAPRHVQRFTCYCEPGFRNNQFHNSIIVYWFFDRPLSYVRVFNILPDTLYEHSCVLCAHRQLNSPPLLNSASLMVNIGPAVAGRSFTLPVLRTFKGKYGHTFTLMQTECLLLDLAQTLKIPILIHLFGPDELLRAIIGRGARAITTTLQMNSFSVVKDEWLWRVTQSRLGRRDANTYTTGWKWVRQNYTV